MRQPPRGCRSIPGSSRGSQHDRHNLGRELQLQLSAQRIFGADDALRDAEEIDVICRRLGLDFMQTLRPGTRVAIDDGLF
jgi:hypothetical protein